MTKTKRKPTVERPPDGRVVAFAEDAFWIGFAARLTGRTQAEFIEEEFREAVRRVLVKHGVDPDKAFEAQASRA